MFTSVDVAAVNSCVSIGQIRATFHFWIFEVGLRDPLAAYLESASGRPQNWMLYSHLCGGGSNMRFNFPSLSLLRALLNYFLSYL